MIRKALILTLAGIVSSFPFAATSETRDSESVVEGGRAWESNHLEAGARWAPVAQLIAASKNAFSESGSMSIPQGGYSERYWSWRKGTRRLLRDLGLVFYDDYPRDVRRWEWFAATVTNPPVYQPGEAAKALWDERYQDIYEAFSKSPDVTDEQRATVYYFAEFRPSYKADVAAAQGGAKIDWAGWQDKVLEMGRVLSTYEGSEVRNMTYAIFKSTERFDAASLQAFRTALKASPNPIQRALSQAPDAVELARVEPVQMRFTAVDGREVDLSRLRGHVVLIDFWAATWCAACEAEGPVLKELYEKYHAEGFEIIGITHELRESDREFLLNYLQHKDIRWPQYFDGQGMDNPYAQRYGIVAIPQYFLIDKDGLLVWDRMSGGGVKNLEAAVRRQLGLPPATAGSPTNSFEIDE